MTQAHENQQPQNQQPPNQQPLHELTQAVAQFVALVDAMQPDDRNRPTPCRSWTVIDVVDHVIGDLAPFLAAARGEEPDYSASPAPITGERAALVRQQMGELVTQWESHLSEGGSADPIALQVSEFTVHGWDLASALGRVDSLDPHLAERAYETMTAQLVPAFRGSEEEGKFFGPAIGVGQDATAYQRLAAFAGRDPNWPA